MANPRIFVKGKTDDSDSVWSEELMIGKQEQEDLLFNMIGVVT